MTPPPVPAWAWDAGHGRPKAAIVADTVPEVQPKASSSFKEMAKAQNPVREAAIQRVLAQIQHWTERELCDRIGELEQSLVAEKRNRAAAEIALREEVDKLTSSVEALRQRAADCWDEASAMSAELEASIAQRQEEEESTRRKARAAARSAEATRFFAAKAQRRQQEINSMRALLVALQHDSADKRSSWQAAVAALQEIASRVGELEREKEALEQAKGWTPEGAVQRSRRSEEEAEMRALLSEQAALQRQLKELQEATELKTMLDNERAKADTERLAISTIIQEIVELEESSDFVDRDSQKKIDELRVALERGAATAQDLRQRRVLAQQWLQGVWSKLCGMKREELVLHEALREEDLWMAHLQARADTLVDELRALEKDVRDGCLSSVTRIENDTCRELTEKSHLEALYRSEAECQLLREALAIEHDEHQMLLHQLGAV